MPSAGLAGTQGGERLGVQHIAGGGRHGGQRGGQAGGEGVDAGVEHRRRHRLEVHCDARKQLVGSGHVVGRTLAPGRGGERVEGLLVDAAGDPLAFQAGGRLVRLIGVGGGHLQQGEQVFDPVIG